MSRAHARTWWDDGDDVYGEPLWVVPPRTERRPALRALPGGGELDRDVPARPPARAALRATDRMAPRRSLEREARAARRSASRSGSRPSSAPRDAPSRRRTATGGDQKPGTMEERLAGLVGDRPDRIGLWAPMLGFFLMAVAAASAHV